MRPSHERIQVDSIEPDARLLDRDGLAALLAALQADGRRLLGPRVQDDAIVLGDVTTVDDLPADLTEEQEGGVYRLKRRGDGALFGFFAGPQAWKRFLHPPHQTVFRLTRTGAGFADATAPAEEPRLAFLGVRSCDLHAIGVLDRVLGGAPLPDGRVHSADAGYAARRADVLLVAVQCGDAGKTCFCDSMGTGPRAAGGFDLALTELLDGGRHAFLVEVGSPRGAAVLEQVPHVAASDADRRAAEQATERARARMGRRLETAGLPDLLLRNLEHPRLDEVAQRCLACANCTMVCPTCFCFTVEDVADLQRETAERTRSWDSCFHDSFSYLHGGSVRATTRSKYRQWFTHKLATWWEQFGSSGCVGCGRCITWCPVGIDITEEAAAIRAADGAPPESLAQQQDRP